MKSVLKFLMIILVAGSIQASQDITKKFDELVTKAEKKAEFFTHRYVNPDGTQVTLTSYFDLSQHAKVIRSTLQPVTPGCYDLRPLEKIYCQAAYATMPLCKQHRGKLGFILGVVSTIIPCAVFHYHDNKC